MKRNQGSHLQRQLISLSCCRLTSAITLPPPMRLTRRTFLLLAAGVGDTEDLGSLRDSDEGLGQARGAGEDHEEQAGGRGQEDARLQQRSQRCASDVLLLCSLGGAAFRTDQPSCLLSLPAEQLDSANRQRAAREAESSDRRQNIFIKLLEQSKSFTGSPQTARSSPHLIFSRSGG